jgi:hypothetical protein
VRHIDPSANGVDGQCRDTQQLTLTQASAPIEQREEPRRRLEHDVAVVPPARAEDEAVGRGGTRAAS